MGLLLVAFLVGCSGGDDGADSIAAPGDGSGPPPADGETGADVGALLADVADVESIDRRPALLGDLGGPDAFVITVDEIDGTVSRFETWTYFDAATQIELVDGEVLWSVEIAELPEGSWLPLAYDPTMFTMLASKADTFAAVGDAELVRIEADTELDVDGAEIWAGEQLVTAFVDDRLVYVESMPLAPGEQEVAG